MIKEEIFLLFTFNSTHLVIKLEKILQNYKIYCRIIPIPSEISAGCGLAIKTSLNDKIHIKDILASEDLIFDVYLVKKKGLKKELEKITI